MQTDVQAGDTSASSWFKRCIEKLHSAPEGSDLRTGLEDIFTDHAHIVLNHKPISISDFHFQLTNRRFAVVGETVDWTHIVDGKADDGGEKKEGTTEAESEEETVAGSYVVTRSLKFMIRAAPAQRKSHVVFSAKVKKDPAQSGDDGRKISELYMTMVDKAVPINLPHLPNMRVE